MTHYFVDRRKPAELDVNLTYKDLAEKWGDYAAKKYSFEHFQKNAGKSIERYKKFDKPVQIAATYRALADDEQEISKLVAEKDTWEPHPIPESWVIVYELPGEPQGKYQAEALILQNHKFGYPKLVTHESDSIQEALDNLKEMALEIIKLTPTFSERDNAHALAAIKAAQGTEYFIARTTKNLKERDSGILPKPGA